MLCWPTGQCRSRRRHGEGNAAPRNWRSNVRPYYNSGGITIYNGDCREVLDQIERVSVVITDPVWPNAVMSLAGSSDPYGLFAEVAAMVPMVSDRLVVQLGFDSDPRFLLGVPKELPYFR